MRFAIVLTASLIASASAHGQHEQQPLDPDAQWTDLHMKEEHHIDHYDYGSFFKLHDFDDSDEWTYEDIARMLGLRDRSTDHISQEDKDKAVQKVIQLYDRDATGTVSYSEYIIGEAQGIHLPDFGYGPGHHGDDEYEYEIHHFEKYHGKDAKLEDLTHPEDIEHFRMHEEMEEAAERQLELDKLSIVEANIPRKFRRGG